MKGREKGLCVCVCVCAVCARWGRGWLRTKGKAGEKLDERRQVGIGNEAIHQHPKLSFLFLLCQVMPCLIRTGFAIESLRLRTKVNKPRGHASSLEGVRGNRGDGHSMHVETGFATISPHFGMVRGRRWTQCVHKHVHATLCACVMCVVMCVCVVMCAPDLNPAETRGSTLMHFIVFFFRSLG